MGLATTDRSSCWLYELHTQSHLKGRGVGQQELRSPLVHPVTEALWRITHHPAPFQKHLQVCTRRVKSLQRLVPVLGNKEPGRCSWLGGWSPPHSPLSRMLKIPHVSVLQRGCEAEIGGEARLCPREICSASASSLSLRRWSSLLTSVHKRVIFQPPRRGTAQLKAMERGARSRRTLSHLP